MIPYRVTAPYDWSALLTLIQREFAYMDGVIDPPSSMHRLTELEIARQAEVAEVWAIGRRPAACMTLTVKCNYLYLGKLAVDRRQRRKGMARMLINTALSRASARGLRGVELQTRVELTANHAAFRALGFLEVSRSAHVGFEHPTTITFRRDLSLGQA